MQYHSAKGYGGINKNPGPGSELIGVVVEIIILRIKRRIHSQLVILELFGDDALDIPRDVENILIIAVNTAQQCKVVTRIGSSWNKVVADVKRRVSIITDRIHKQQRGSGIEH